MPDISEQIDLLIVETPDPKDKALLLILKKISDNLEDNTCLTRTLTSDLKAHTEAFQKHEQQEMTLINQGRGMVRVALLALAMFQGLFAWYFQDHLRKVEGLHSDVRSLEEYRAAHITHHQTEESYKK